MLTVAKPSDSLAIEAWLRTMQLAPRKVADPANNWRLDFHYPAQSKQEMSLVNPKTPSSAVVVAYSVTLSPEHLAAFQLLELEDKQQFAFDFQLALNRESVEYMLIGLSPEIVGCPTAFQITSCIYDGAITLDNLALRMSSVFKAQLAGVLCIQRHLAPKAGGGTDQFAFRRLGIQ